MFLGLCAGTLMIGGASGRVSTGVFFGLTHDALGNADLQISPLDDSLIISNIGATGDDGVSIELLGVEGWIGELDTGATGQLPEDALVQLTPVSVTDDGFTELSYTIEITGTESGDISLALTDLSEDPEVVHVELFSNGQLVARRDFTTPLPPQILQGAIASTPTDGVIFETSGTGERKRNLLIFVTPTVITIAGEAPVTADSCLITLEGFTSDSGGIERVDILAANLVDGVFRGISERLRHRDGPILTALGDVVLTGGSSPFQPCFTCDNTVSFLGATGDDGVLIRQDDLQGPPEPTGEFDINLSNIVLPGGSPAADITATAVLELGAQGSGAFVQPGLIAQGAPGGANGGRLLLQRDQLDTASAVVEVYSNGVFVGSNTVPLSGPGMITDLGMFNAPLPLPQLLSQSFTRSLLEPADPGTPGLALGFRFAQPVQYDVAPNPLQGDEVRVLFSQPVANVADIPGVRLTANSVDEFTIGDIRTAGVVPDFVVFGLELDPIGNALLDKQPNGTLLVSNIVGGADGFRADIGESEGADITFLDGTLDLTIPELLLDVRLLDGFNNEVIRTVTENTDFDSADVRFMLGDASAYEVSIFDFDKELIATFPLSSKDALTLFGGGFGDGKFVELALDELRADYIQVSDDPQTFQAQVRLRLFGGNTTVSAPGIPAVFNASVIIVTAQSSPQTALTQPAETVEVRARETGDIIISNLGIVQFGYEHNAAGDALIKGETRVTGKRVVVSNVGPSGMDGVVTDYQNFGPEPFFIPQRGDVADLAAVQYSITVQDNGGPTPGFTWQQVGVIDGFPPDQLINQLSDPGETARSRDARGGEVFRRDVFVSDFQSFTPAEFDVRVLNETGTVVAESLGLTAGSLGSIFGNSPPAKFRHDVFHSTSGLLGIDGVTFESVQSLFWINPQEFELPGELFAQGTELQITAQPSPEGFATDARTDQLITLMTSADGRPVGFTITEEEFDEQPPCPGDVNDSGAVDTTDFFDLLQNWGECPAVPELCPWDVNGPEGGPDGVVSTADFFTLLQNWGPCPQ
jgi:hypothetical protein